MEAKYPIFFQYGKYSCNIDNLNESEMKCLKQVMRNEFGVTLEYKGVNF